ncbi:mechanosensitive ion channel [Hydrogenophaga sp.]|uniref:mechanosensitive ion channel n=1 Tax=Hydrogenophaga sp. TaxID=1904254 RepID=UPI00272F0EF8|nr:mechanosensitive ion channel [Hydrogenophaga sp.]MDP2073923.1 mechanosensitive ion channel [Hydrogenophaga sp.]MDP3107381.1 mechanosensitive ion channel [Hydrogenophaga sp.]MDZ4400548.1 mechanosensitive ion channel [Hydrogenophaga sp.]
MNTNALWDSLQSNLGTHIPQLLGALAIFILGWLIAVLVRAATRKSLGFVGVNHRFGKLTGTGVDIEGAVALGLFWVVILLTLVAVFNSLNLAIVSGPFSAFTTQLFEYAPRLLGGLVLALVGWLVASVVRALTQKLLDKTTLDDKLSEHADMAPISEGLAGALFWLVILLFVPAILGALQLEGLLDPLRSMVTKTLDMLPNAVAAIVIGGVGWIVATVLRKLTTHLSRTAGIDRLGSRAGLAETVQISSVIGMLVFIAVFLPSLIAALDALKIEAISRPATDMLSSLMQAVPNIVAAGLILVVTWLVASFASQLLASLLAALGFDTLPARVQMAHAFEKTSASRTVGRVVLFFAMLFATVEAAAQLGFHQVSDIVASFIRFGGDILLGSAILVIGFWLANVAFEAINRASGARTQGLARIGRYAILALVIAMGLRAMGIADDIVNLAFGLTLGAVAVAFALSFGLGGREAAGKLMDHWLTRLRKED